MNTQFEKGCTYLLASKEYANEPADYAKYVYEWQVVRITTNAIKFKDVRDVEDPAINRWVTIEDLDKYFILIEKL